MAAPSQNINVGTFLPRTSTERQEAVDAGFAELVGGPVIPLRPGICPDCRTELAQKMLRLKRKTWGKK